MNRKRTPALLWGGVGLLALVCVQSVMVTLDPENPWTQGMDALWRAHVGVGPDAGIHDGPLPMLFQHLGQIPGFVLMMLILPIGLISLGRWRSALFVVAVQLAAPGLVSQTLKNLVNRPRPTDGPGQNLFGPLFLVDHGSFPSGHAVSAGAIAVILIVLVPATKRAARVVAIALAVLVMAGMVWQRTLINAHWLSDTLAGLAAGAGTALILWWAFEPWLRSDADRTPVWMRRPVAAPVLETDHPDASKKENA